MSSIAPFGSWNSPISSRLLTESCVLLQELNYDPQDNETIYWLERRFDDNSRSVVCSWNIHSRTIVSWTPKDFSVASRVHEYGGGSFLIHGGIVYFSDAKDQRIYCQKSPDATPEPLTEDRPKATLRFADGVYANNGIYCVSEVHSDTGEPANNLVFISVVSKKMVVIVEGASFYACPRLNMDGTKLAWMQWSHPNMPWDTTQILLADIDKSNSTVVKSSIRELLSTPDVCFMEPWISPFDDSLFYISDESNWWNLYSISDAGSINVCPIEKEIGLPHWKFSRHSYAINATYKTKIVAIVDSTIGMIDTVSKSFEKFDTGFESHEYLAWIGSSVFTFASSPLKFTTFIQYDLNTKKTCEIQASRNVGFDNGYISVPERMTFPSGPVSSPSMETCAHAYYYGPKNCDYQAPEGTCPPLLVKLHGGPTAATNSNLDLKVQFYTSRGFAVLDVDYRGSTGYGRTYRQLLYNNWGIYDVEDCCNGATYLVNQGKADPKKLCISGGSAGGFTVLAALTFNDVFAVGACNYGVSDLTSLVSDDHKFESRYTNQCIGEWPKEKQIYIDRSPINHVEKLNCPVVFFHGLEDKVVPPKQSELMFSALNEKKITTACVYFKGEAHGFKMAENVHLSIDGAYYFFCKCLGINPSLTIPEWKLKIYNL